MTERWILAGVLLAAGFALGAIAGLLVRKRLIRARGGDATSSIAGATGLFVFWVLALSGALAAIAMVRPETLEDLPRQVLDYTPRLLVAGLILLAGYSVALGASRVVAFSLERASGKTIVRTAGLVRWAILGAALILALAQLGVDTTILTLLVGLVGFGIALSAAILIGLGGRPLAREIAAGRYLGRFLSQGLVIEAEGYAGRVVRLHPATVELETASGAMQHVPYSRLLASGITIPAGAGVNSAADEQDP